MVCPQFPTSLEPLQIEVTVYVLLGFEKDPNCARFFVTRNSDMETRFRQPPDWGKFGFIDVEAVKNTKTTGIF